MTVFELKIALIEILAEESGPEADWDHIENLSERTYVRLTEPDTPPGFPARERHRLSRWLSQTAG